MEECKVFYSMPKCKDYLDTLGHNPTVIEQPNLSCIQMQQVCTVDNAAPLGRTF